MSNYRSPSPSCTPGLQRHKPHGRRKKDPSWCRRSCATRSNIGCHGTIRVRQNHPSELPQWTSQARLWSNIPQQRPIVQEMEAEDMLCPAAGHLLSGSYTQTNPGVHCQTKVTWHYESYSENAVRGSHHWRVGVAALSRYHYRRLPQKRAEWWGEKEGKYCLWIVDQSLAHATRRKCIYFFLIEILKLFTIQGWFIHSICEVLEC